MKTNLILISVITMASIITTNAQSAKTEKMTGSEISGSSPSLLTASAAYKEETPEKVYTLLPMTVFPDSVTNSISVSVPFTSSSKGKVNIYNEKGEIVYFKYYDSIPHIFEVAIPASVHTGKYFIQVIGDDKHAIQKFVKK